MWLKAVQLLVLHLKSPPPLPPHDASTAPPCSLPTLPPGPQGVAIEVYCFANDTNWVAFEDIQADLFDRILAMVPEFGLRVFQEPSGSDLEALVGTPAREGSS